MQKFNQSVNMDTTTTAPSSKYAQNDEQYLMSVVQATVAKQITTLPTSLPNPTPFNLKSIIKQACNSSTRWHLAVSTLHSFERRQELKPDGNKHWDPGCTTGIHNDKIYLILIAASEETMANEMNSESCTELDSHANMPMV